MLHPQKLGLIPIFIGACRVAISRNMPMSKGLWKREHRATAKGKTNEISIEAYSQATPRPAKSLVRQRLRTATNKPPYL